MKLSRQAIVTLMVTLQKSLLEQADIVPMLESWVLEETEEGLIVINPPTKMGIEDQDADEEEEE